MPKIADVDNLMLAYYKARRGKSGKKSVINYGKHLNNNIMLLRDSLLKNNVSVGNYTYFHVYDPKKRLICAASFAERVLHHAIINVCKPYFERHLIYDTYATRENKGSYMAIERARRAMKEYPYVAKLDVRKYFDSIDHDILKTKINRLFKDKELLLLFDAIIDSYQIIPNCGIPIGNLTSQYFANYYLSDADHYIKEKLRTPFYVRYMDDMLVFASTKEKVKEYVSAIDSYFIRELKLTLKQPQILKVTNGVSFLGYRLYPNKIVLNRRSKLRFMNRIREYDCNRLSGIWDENEYMQHITPLLAFADKAYTKQLRRELCCVNRLWS